MIPRFRVFDSKSIEMEEVYLIDWQWPEQDAWINDNPSDDLIFMQSTGLRDKNGVEIFEGDVVNINHTFRNPMTGSGTLTLNKNFEIVFINGMFTREGSSMGLSGDLKYLTVIGNVWENEGLLNDC